MTDTSAESRSAIRNGLIFGVGAYTIWGLFPIYLKALDDVAALEILSHRILWSVPFGALLISLRHQWKEVRTARVTKTA